MIILYHNSKYNKGIIDFSKKILPGLIEEATTIEDALKLIKEDTKLIFDLRYLVDNIDKDINYADSAEIDNLYKYLNQVELNFTPVIKDELLYLFSIPSSPLNMERYIVSSVISNLNLFNQAKFHETPDGIYQRNGNKLIGYKFNVINKDIIKEIKLKSL